MFLKNFINQLSNITMLENPTLRTYFFHQREHHGHSRKKGKEKENNINNILFCLNMKIDNY